MSGAWGFFRYEAIDYKAAQNYLDRRAAGGWVLKNIRLGCLAQFERGEGRSHFVDLDLRRAMEETDPGYLQLCADAGWEQVQRYRGMLLFRSLPGARPAPIQTDPGIEQERFWKQYMLKQLLVTALALLVCALPLLFLSSSGITFSPVVASNASLLLLLLFALASLSLLWSGVTVAAYFLKCRRAGGMVIPGRRSTAARNSLDLAISILFVLSGVLAIAEGAGLAGRTVDLSWYSYHQEYTATVERCQTYPVLMGTDLDLPGTDSDVRFLDGRRSVLAENLDYSEVTTGAAGASHILTTQRYRCAAAFLARWTLSALRYETAHGGFLWGDLTWTPAPGLGFDESWSARGGSYLLLRQGNVAALVGASDLDLTDPEVLALVRTRLRWEA